MYCTECTVDRLGGEILSLKLTYQKGAVRAPRGARMGGVALFNLNFENKLSPEVLARAHTPASDGARDACGTVGTSGALLTTIPAMFCSPPRLIYVVYAPQTVAGEGGGRCRQGGTKYHCVPHMDEQRPPSPSPIYPSTAPPQSA